MQEKKKHATFFPFYKNKFCFTEIIFLIFLIRK